MKTLPYLFFFLVFFISCSNNDETEIKTESSKTLNNDLDNLVGTGKISPENDIIQLSSSVTGLVEKIYIQENDTVSKGSIILELDHYLEDAKIEQLNNQLKTQSAQIMADEATIEEIEAKYANAKIWLQTVENLLDKDVETKKNADDAATNVKSLHSNLKRAEALLNVSKSKLEEIKTSLSIAEIEREKKFIKSPIDGTLLELTVLIGGSVNSQQSFGQICPKGKIIAVCEIDETHADKVYIGQKGWIRNLGSLDTLSTGTVYFAASFLKKKSLFTDQPGEKEDRRVRTIKLLLDQPGNLLLNARVECVLPISTNPKN